MPKIKGLGETREESYDYGYPEQKRKTRKARNTERIIKKGAGRK